MSKRDLRTSTDADLTLKRRLIITHRLLSVVWAQRPLVLVGYFSGAALEIAESSY